MAEYVVQGNRLLQRNYLLGFGRLYVMAVFR